MSKALIIRETAQAIPYGKLFRAARRRQRERERKAGKHRCVKVAYGTVTRVTGRGGRVLKRPVVVLRFYECKVCGRDMTRDTG